MADHFERDMVYELARTADAVEALVDAVEALVATIKEQASTERTVELGTISTVPGPAVGDPLAYVVVDKDDDVRASRRSIADARSLLTDYETKEPEWAPYRLVIVYDLPVTEG